EDGWRIRRSATPTGCFVAGAGLAVGGYNAPLGEGVGEDRGGGGRFFGGGDEVARGGGWRERGRGGGHHRARVAVLGEVRLHLRRGGLCSRIHAEFRRERFQGNGNRNSGHRPGSQRDHHRVVVDDDGGNGCAVLPNHVVDFPAVGIALGREVAVVADNVAGDGLDASRDDAVGELGENAVGRTVEFLFQHKRVARVGELGISAADQEQVGRERAVGRNDAARFERGVEAIVRAENGERVGGGEQLHVGSRDEVFVGVLLKERFA